MPETVPTSSRHLRSGVLLRLSYAIFFAIHCVAAPTYFLENEEPRRFFYVLFALATLCAVVDLVVEIRRPDVQSASWRRAISILRLAVGIPLWGVLIPSIFVVAAMGIAVVLAGSHLHAAVVVGADLAFVSLFVGLSWRRLGLRRGSWRAAHGLAHVCMINMLLTPLYSLWLYAPLSPAGCESGFPTEAVTRLTGQRFIDERSQPYRVLYLAEDDLLVTPFKQMGELSSAFWNRDQPGQLVVLRTAGDPPYEMAVLPLPGNNAPEHPVYDATRREVIVGQPGVSAEGHRISIVDVSAFPDLRVVATLPFPGPPPDDIVLAPDHQGFVVYDQKCGETFFDRDSLQAVAWNQVRCAPFFFLDHAFASEDGTLAYISVAGQSFIERNLLTGTTRWTSVPFGGGDLAVVEELGRVYQVDFLFHAVNVIRLWDFQLERRLELPYAVRAIAADVQRDLLFLGESVNAKLHVFRLSTLEEIEIRSTQLGSFLRFFEYDPKRGRLFSSSTCGVYQVSIDALLALSP
jgi:hypothetical protein